MIRPNLDNRTRSQVLEQLHLRASSYVPEWRFDGSPEDPGAALAEVFADMYIRTLDRYNALPKKYYIELLNMLGVTEPDVMSAAGYVRFHVNGAAENAVIVPEHTTVGAPSQESETVVFETTRRIEATAAELQGVFFCDNRKNVLQKMDLTKHAQPLFGMLESENLRSHMLYLGHSEVLSIRGACIIDVSLRHRAAFQDSEMAELLADRENTNWSWFDGESWVTFDEVKAEGDLIRLKKTDPRPLCAFEEDRMMIRCEFLRFSGDMILDEVRLSSSPLTEIPMDASIANDLLLEDGRGYCFGRHPSEYDTFYLRNDRVFCKRGTRVAVRLSIAIEEQKQEGGDTVRYDWSKNVISKEDIVPITPDDVIPRQVIWEYYNGMGWAVLPVKGDKNPFLPGAGEKIQELTFTVPDNMTQSNVCSEDGYFIRARVIEMENAYSLHPRWLLPYIKEATCRWHYETGRRCQYLEAVNDGTHTVIDGAENIARLQLTAFHETEAPGRTLFLCFDRSPHAMPLSILLQLSHTGHLPGKVRFEVLSHGRFVPVRVADNSQNLCATGLISLYIPEPISEELLFGETGYWLRAVCDATQFREEALPRIESIAANVTTVIQRQQAEPQYFDTDPYDKNKEFALLYAPVVDCRIWVDENAHLTEDELRNLRQIPGELREETEEGETHTWVQWHRTEDLRLCEGDSRVFELDSNRGEIRFGDNIHGRIPPEGSLNILVEYTYGGGTRGNMPAGAVTDLMGTVPMVDEVSNVTAACGGMDPVGSQWLEDVGTLRLRHLGRALSGNDYTDLIRQFFPRVRHAQCFSGMDQTGAHRSGHVTVVFMCAAASDMADTDGLAQDICRMLNERCDCTLSASNRLHVLPAQEIHVSVEARVTMLNPDYAASTQRQLSEEITRLVNDVWRQRGIGREINTGELYELLAGHPNVGTIRHVLIKGIWDENGVEHACNLEEKHDFPYAVVTSGEHIIWSE